MASVIWPTESDREESAREFLDQKLKPLQDLKAEASGILAEIDNLGPADLGSLASMGEILETQVEDVLNVLKQVTSAIQQKLAE